MDVLPQIDLVIVDECHNLKNIGTNRSGEFTELVERTRGKQFLMLSASPIPNRLCDAGYLLYMLNPEKYRHYATNPFDYSSDRFSIRNAMNSGAWFSFTRDDVATLFNLPDLQMGNPDIGIGHPHRFEISDEFAHRYFQEWSADMSVKSAALSRILLEAEFGEIEKMCRRIVDYDPEAQIGVYSFYKTGFSAELAERLERIFPGEVGLITGDEPAGATTREKVRKRIEIAKRFTRGDLRATVNTTSTVSESISFITGDRPGYVIMAEPPRVPATYDQMIGRFYRIGQEAPVTVVEMVPYSRLLSSMMVREMQGRKAEGIRFRRSWQPTTVFEDKHAVRLDKVRLIHRVSNAEPIDDLLEVADAVDTDEEMEEEERPKNGRVVISVGDVPDEEDPDVGSNKSFNEGLKKVRGHIGHGIESLSGSVSRRHLIDSYASEKWELTSSADTNRAIAEAIMSIEAKKHVRLDDILDWGCGTACLARALRRPIHCLDAMPEMLAVGKEKCAELKVYSPEEIDKYFHRGDAKKMSCFEDRSFDVVSSSYAIQYNAQGYRHRRDVEQIFLETNRVLRKGGYAILALPNQATTDGDINAFVNVLLPRYGFDVKFSNYVTGHCMNERTGNENKIFQGFYLILAQKAEDKGDLVGNDADVFVFAPYKKVGVGGKREIELMEGRSCAGYKVKKNEADIFRVGKEALLGDCIKESI
jgi:ubiquinone/menaquinone biosynthesis C-methylase UbiE